MIDHNSFYRSLAKKGGTITLPSNDQPIIGAFSIGEVGSALPKLVIMLKFGCQKSINQVLISELNWARD